MPEQSIVCEQVRLVPSITVDVHPTIETTPPAKEKETDTAQSEVEKTLGLKITGGVDFKMPITIFHASASNLISCDSTATFSLFLGQGWFESRPSWPQAWRLNCVDRRQRHSPDDFKRSKRDPSACQQKHPQLQTGLDSVITRVSHESAIISRGFLF